MPRCSAARDSQFQRISLLSLNAKDAEQYQKYCNSIFEIRALDEIIKFAKHCKKNINKPVFSVIAFLNDRDIKECEEIAKNLKFDLIIRKKKI